MVVDERPVCEPGRLALQSSAFTNANVSKRWADPFLDTHTRRTGNVRRGSRDRRRGRRYVSLSNV